jgi:2,3-bisphosphoglycerate-independent phosphoglycerate mutase
MQAANKPVVLMILDGWGYRAETDHNAIALAETPCWDRLWQQDPHSLIKTSGNSVGLPEGQMGNSEVGHLNIGAGRIVHQEFTRIGQSIEDGSFQKNAVICSSMDAAISEGKTVHIMGLLSPGGVHSHENHFHAAIKLAADRGARKISIHLFLDGRDTPPRSAEASIRAMQDLTDTIQGANIDSVCGRYYAMDRDKRWERVEKAYELIAKATSARAAGTALEALSEAYTRGENDEFVKPTVIGNAPGVVQGDCIFFINFRADRARELSRAFVENDFQGFHRSRIRLSAFVCMTAYLDNLPAAVAFPSVTLPNLLVEEISRHGLRQLRIAETEKYAHVTFFFNGGREEPYPLEDRILIPSPAVATYDLQPEMSSEELAAKLVDCIQAQTYDLIICNVANPDMVGHSGLLSAAVKAVEAVDRLLARVIVAIDQVNGELLITADHGNVEQMIDRSTGQSHTAHTTNPVPLLFHGRPATLEAEGSLRDIAPSILHLLGLPQPAVMTGSSLIRLTDQA